MNKTRAIKNEATKLVSPIFSKNQLDIILKKKKRVNWSTDEIAKAFTLRYFSKRAYLYVRHELHHPLPGISSLQQWAKKGIGSLPRLPFPRQTFPRTHLPVQYVSPYDIFPSIL
ncbi:THAP-type domain-containing protein, partial [Aphis craccivora]